MKHIATSYTYSFVVTLHDYFPVVVDITRNGDSYCRFSEGVFLSCDGKRFDKMPINEKIKLWEHINYHGNDVGEHELNLSF